MDELSLLSHLNGTQTAMLKFTIRWLCMLFTFYKRPPSHGLDHAIDVAYLAGQIYYVESKEKPNSEYLTLIMLLGLIHDVLDTKYNDCSRHLLFRFVMDLNISYGLYIDVDTFLESAELVSLSLERGGIYKGKKLDMAVILNPSGLRTKLIKPYLFFRNIVSDADKLKRSGTDGFLRLVLFLKEQNPSITIELKNNQILTISADGALQLEKYMKTEEGKRLEKIARQNYLRTMSEYFAITDPQQAYINKN